MRALSFIALHRYAERMMSTSTPVKSEQIFIPGPVGELEALIDAPADAQGAHVAVVCHPHPLQGGTMTNKVAHMLAKSFNAVGIPAVRFNFRGVGRSAGAYAHADGETQDAIAVVEWARSRWPRAQISLAGFSFGGAVAIRAAVATHPARLITVAPAVDRVHVALDRLPTCPWLVVQGDADDVVDPTTVRAWVEQLPNPPEFLLLSGIGHFFHGRLNELKDVVMSWLRQGAVTE
jgi:alpha/beta superfamily hydrolase